MASGDSDFEEISARIRETQGMLTSVSERVRAERDQLERDFPKLQKFEGKPIKLDIGGFIFKTSLETLRKDTDSMLASMFSGRFDMKEQEDGSYFIDRDPTHFRFILNFLRTGKVIVPHDTIAREELLLEAEFYNIKPIIDKLNETTDSQSAIQPVVSEFSSSTLMKTEDKRVLLSWLSGQMNWRLIYKASRDGYRAADFHRCCDNKGETISVIHTTGGYLFGGYTDVPWTSARVGVYKRSSQSFLFAFWSSALGNTAVKATIVDSNHAVYHRADVCCAFGGGSNICISDSSNTNFNSYSNWSNGEYYSYPPGVTSNKYWLVGQQTFQTQDIEVFGH
ncbi:uncharacterized protein LOC134178447 [Corticium candelabrum]|uniref:uncharacterized protein LOC134178447 n=1 Tax=Corticium candelabrum TaxID=121492 RepID=UPI002E26E1C9|nr:uncharacterized protein LOC134178447 [Corticium candelabrum]